MKDIIIARNPVLVRRLARQWSQAELAQRAGISRAAVSAIEGERLSPSVMTALALAAVFECSVEELFRRGGTTQPHESSQAWAWVPRGESSRYWEAEIGRRRLLYPVEAMTLNPTPHDGVWQNGVLHGSTPASAETTLVMASCDPAAGLLAAEYARASGFRLLVFPRGGRTALELMKQGLVHVAGLHYSTEDTPDRNAETVRTQLGSDYRLLRVAKWECGIALAADDACRSPESVARRSLRWAARETGSAARECLDEPAGAAPFRRARSQWPCGRGGSGARRLGRGGRVCAVQRGGGGLEFSTGAPRRFWICVFQPPFNTTHAFRRLCGCCVTATAAALSANCPATTPGRPEKCLAV